MNSCISNCFWCSGACMSLLLWAEVGKSGLAGEYALQTASFCISMKSTWNKSINWEHIFQLHFTAFERINHMCSGNVSSDHKLRCGLGGRWSNICSFSMLYLSTLFSLPSTWWQSLSLLPRFSVFLPFPWGSKLVRMGYNPGFITTDAGLAPSKISLTLWSSWPSSSRGVLTCCLSSQGPSVAASGLLVHTFSRARPCNCSTACRGRVIALHSLGSYFPYRFWAFSSPSALA